MSTYTEYDTVSEKYDEGRYADGVDIMTAMLTGMLKKDPSQIHVLEAGCGTGNYSLGFAKHGIGKITMIDASEGMLNKAKNKLEYYKETIHEIKQAVLPVLPYADESFDAVTFIQVIHHLDQHHINDDLDLSYPVLTKALVEAHRVLKTGGVLLIDHSFSENVDALWGRIAPKSISLFKKLFINEKLLIDKIYKVGFQNLNYIVRPNTNMTKSNVVENIERVNDPNWRRYDSGWGLVEKAGELDSIIKLINEKKKEGKLKKYTDDLKKDMDYVGTHNTIFVQKL